MPNRILKESFFTSPNLAQVSLEAEGLFMRLICLADDHGRVLAQPAAIRGVSYWARPRVSERDVVGWLLELEAADVIRTYEIDAKHYAFFPTWAKHQRVRNVREKHPAPPDELLQVAASRGELPQVAARARAESESESESNPNQDSRSPAAPVECAFDRFWKVYPKKKAKKAARAAWQRAKINGQIDTVIAAVERQTKSEDWRKEGGRFIPLPATWLNQGRWEDEDTTLAPPPPAAAPVTAQDIEWARRYEQQTGRQGRTT